MMHVALQLPSAGGFGSSSGSFDLFYISAAAPGAGLWEFSGRFKTSYCSTLGTVQLP